MAPARTARCSSPISAPRSSRSRTPPTAATWAARVGPYFLGPDDSHFFQSFNRNKKSITLDLKNDGARDVLHALVRRADAVLDNLRGDLPHALGLTYEALEDSQSAHRLRAPVGLRPQRTARELAGLRLSDAGGGRLPLAHRRA